MYQQIAVTLCNVKIHKIVFSDAVIVTCQRPNYRHDATKRHIFTTFRCDGDKKGCRLEIQLS